MAWLDDHPPVRSQWYAKRSRPLTGCTVLHTAESIMDTVGPDTGAENVAEFIRTRTTPGSYHDLCDSDSAIPLVDYSHGAFHDGTGSNNWALSLSFACRTSDWRAMSPAKRRAFLRQGAIAFARQQAYRRRIGAPLTELRLITKAQSDRGESGFTYHGLRDPGRRSDPGAAAPNLFPFDEFIAECRAVLAGTNPEEDDMAFTDQHAKMLEHLYHSMTPGIEGVKHNGQGYWAILDIPKKVWEYPIGGIAGWADGKPTYGNVEAWRRLGNVDTKTATEVLSTVVANAVASVQASLPEGQQLTREQIEVAAKAGALAALEQGVVTVDVRVSGGENAEASA